MAREHAVALLQKFLLAKGRGAEAPVRMCRQLFKALVPPVNGEEKRVRVGGVNMTGTLNSAAFSNIGASRSSSTRSKSPVESRRLVPRSFQTFRPQAPCSTIFSSRSAQWLKKSALCRSVQSIHA
jgi:hypothetical protein